MSSSEKLDILKAVEDEKKFRETVLQTLFDKMGIYPVHTHGTNERGKDFVCKEENTFGLLEWIAVVAKVGKITGATSGSGSFQTVLNQVQEAFEFEYKDPKEKRLIPISKVFVITNDTINDQAREKIVDKLSKPGAAHANVHFIAGKALEELIDDHWPDFWRISADLLTDEDRMTEDAGLVLYVLARAHHLSQLAKQKKKVEREMSREKIRAQTGLPNDKLDSALKYLDQAEYAEKIKKRAFALHSRETAGTLLTYPDQIRLLFAITNIVRQGNRFTLKSVLEESKKEILQFSKPFVTETIQVLLKGGYIAKDKARGKDNFALNIDMVGEERPYLDNWLKYLGAVPVHIEKGIKLIPRKKV